MPSNIEAIELLKSLESQLKFEGDKASIDAHQWKILWLAVTCDKVECLTSNPLTDAAPDLLEALEELTAHYIEPTGIQTAQIMDNEQFGKFLKKLDCNRDKVITKARAAIAKATPNSQHINR